MVPPTTDERPIDTLEPPTPKSPNVLSGTCWLDGRSNDGVKFYSIIGALRAGGVQETTDGVVPYWSSHLDGAESERVFRSDHSVQKDPEAILEVRRILLEHSGQAPAITRAPTPGFGGPARSPANRSARSSPPKGDE